MHLASSRLFSMVWNSQTARAVNTTRYGVQPPVIMTETGSGVTVRQTTMSQTAGIFTTAAENGHVTENVL